LVRVFIVYGGNEGERIGRQIETYLKSNNIGAFLASPKSPEILPSEDFQTRIDCELKNANLAIIVITDGIHSSDPALKEIDRILDELRYPYIPFVKNGVTLPTRLEGQWHVPFENNSLTRKKLIQLELKMWRYYDRWKELQTIQKPENEVIIPKKIYGLEVQQ